MQRSTRWLAISTCVAVCLWPATTFAQGASRAEAPLTLDQARAAFTNAGYQTAQVHNWDWTSPPVTTFQVRDPANGRAVLVLVYQSTGVAEAERVQAEAREQALSSGHLVSDQDPHLVLGYGQSAWNRNVAMVQTTQTRLERDYQIQNEPDIGLFVDSDVLDEKMPSVSVDLDFQQALSNATVNL
jgi:hypothetical protein